MAAQPESGLSIQECCANRHVSVSSFYLWRNKLAGATDESANQDGWSPLSLTANEQAPSDEWQIELTLPGGVVLRLHAHN